MNYTYDQGFCQGGRIGEISWDRDNWSQVIGEGRLVETFLGLQIFEKSESPLNEPPGLYFLGRVILFLLSLKIASRAGIAHVSMLYVIIEKKTSFHIR